MSQQLHLPPWQEGEIDEYHRYAIGLPQHLKNIRSLAKKKEILHGIDNEVQMYCSVPDLSEKAKNQCADLFQLASVYRAEIESRKEARQKRNASPSGSMGSSGKSVMSSEDEVQSPETRALFEHTRNVMRKSKMRPRAHRQQYWRSVKDTANIIKYSKGHTVSTRKRALQHMSKSSPNDKVKRNFAGSSFHPHENFIQFGKNDTPADKTFGKDDTYLMKRQFPDYREEYGLTQSFMDSYVLMQYSPLIPVRNMVLLYDALNSQLSEPPGVYQPKWPNVDKMMQFTLLKSAPRHFMLRGNAHDDALTAEYVYINGAPFQVNGIYFTIVTKKNYFDVLDQLRSALATPGPIHVFTKEDRTLPLFVSWDVLRDYEWHFSNLDLGIVFPSYETHIAPATKHTNQSFLASMDPGVGKASIGGDNDHANEFVVYTEEISLSKYAPPEFIELMREFLRRSDIPDTQAMPSFYVPFDPLDDVVEPDYSNIDLYTKMLEKQHVLEVKRNGINTNRSVDLLAEIDELNDIRRSRKQHPYNDILRKRFDNVVKLHHKH
jgi:hypothetical protein